MGTYAIELNDSGFSAAGGGQSLSPPSPGYALLDGKAMVVGAQAQRQARLKPRWVNNRFWDQLDASPMPRPFPRALSRADVAHAHLSRLWTRIQGEMGAKSQDSVLLAVPGSFSAAQLGLILGIARACDIPVSGIVDAATAAVSTQPLGERVLHLDATLHRMVWTELVHDGELTRRRVEVVETGGLASIWDAWAKRIAELLIRQTRFDPFHHGSADQTLYDRLPDWLEELGTSGIVVVTLESESKEYSVELSAQGASGIVEAVLEPVVELARSLASSEQTATLMVSHRVAAIPGLLPLLSQVAGTQARVLEDGASLAGSLEHTEAIASTGSDLPFVLRLPVELRPSPSIESTPPPELVEENPTVDQPTHLLLQGVAHAISAEPLWLGSAVSPGERSLNVGGPMPGLSRRHCSITLQGRSIVVEDHSSFGTFLNGRKVEGTVDLETGDRLRLGSPGVEVQMIRVAGDDV